MLNQKVLRDFLKKLNKNLGKNRQEMEQMLPTMPERPTVKELKWGRPTNHYAMYIIYKRSII